MGHLRICDLRWGFPDKLQSTGTAVLGCGRLALHSDAAPHHICCKLKISVSGISPHVSGQVILDRYIPANLHPLRKTNRTRSLNNIDGGSVSWGDKQAVLQSKEYFCWKSLQLCKNPISGVKSGGQGEPIVKVFLVPFPTPPPPPSHSQSSTHRGKKHALRFSSH